MDPHVVNFEIVRDVPPIFDKILEVFPMASKPGVLFCWGGTIFNPSGVEIPTYLIAHENVHRKQQDKNILGWWDKYLADPEFRLRQEVPAHQAEYRQYSIDYSHRTMRRLALKTIAGRLSGPLYGNMISFDRAKVLVKEREDGERPQEAP